MLAVKPEKRGEFLSAIGGLTDSTVRLPDCSACRLSADYYDADGYFLISYGPRRVPGVRAKRGCVNPHSAAA